MSDEDRCGEAPQDPPWSPELLAEFHAGSLDRETADELRPRVRADPAAQEILSALDATGAALDGQPPLTMPDHVAGRIEEALRAEARSRAAATSGDPSAASQAADSQQGRPADDPPVVDLDAARQRPGFGRRRGTGPRTDTGHRTGRRLGWAAGLVAAAAAVLGVVVVVTPDTGGGDRTRAADPAAPSRAAPEPAGPPPLALRGSDLSLTGEQFSAVLGKEQYSGLSDPERLIGCLQANGVDSGNPLGAREISLGGEPAQLLVLPTGRIGEFRLLAVGPDCGPGNPATIAETTVGG